MGKTGIIYIMTTSVKGLIKIGKTDNFKNRMQILEQNGYWNVSGLHPFFAVRVKDYDEKEKLIHTVFSKSQVANSELFALDKEIAKEMLESFDGEQVFPERKSEISNKRKDRGEIRERFTFAKAEIPVGSKLAYIKDPSIICEIIDDVNHVKYKDKIYTISALAMELSNSIAAQGSRFFTYNGEMLEDIRKRKGF